MVNISYYQLAIALAIIVLFRYNVSKTCVFSYSFDRHNGVSDTKSKKMSGKEAKK